MSHFLVSIESWKKWLILGSSALIASSVSLYYFYTPSRAPKTAASVLTSELQPLETAIALKDEGNRHFKAGCYAKAAECYTKALKQCPPSAIEERVTFYQNRAVARENLREFEAALDDCNAALALTPTHLKVLNRRARIYERLENLPHCLLDVTACCLLERFANRENVSCASRLLKQLSPKLAKEEFSKIPRTLPSSDFVESYFRSWISNPFTIEAMKIPANSRGVRKKEDEEEAEALKNAVEKNVKLPPKLAKAYDDLVEAFAELQSGAYESSWQLVKAAVENLNSSIRFDLYAFEKSRLSDLEKPEPARARALLLEATYRALSGDTDKAKAQLLAVGETVYSDPSVRVNALIKAAVLYATSDQDMYGCTYCFKEAESIDSECVDVYLHRGQINLLAGNLELAKKDFDEAVRLKPDSSIAQAQKTFLHYQKTKNKNKKGSARKCLQEFEALRERFPKCVETHFLYAQVLIENGEFEKADQVLARLHEISPKSGLAYCHRGMLRLRQNQDHEAADECLRRAIEVDPRCELALELRAQLAMERGDLEKALELLQCALVEARTLQNQSQLIALRENVKAQLHAVKCYGISIGDLYADLKNNLHKGIAADGDAGMLL